jgi:hypothetical protein
MRPLALGLFDEAMMGLSADERDGLIHALARVRTNLSRRAPQEVMAHG